MEDQLVNFTKGKKFLEDRKFLQECMEAFAPKSMKKTASTKKKVVYRPLRRAELEKEYGPLWKLPKAKKPLWPDERSNKRKSIVKPDRHNARATIRTSTSTQLRTATTKSSRTPSQTTTKSRIPNLNRRALFDKSVPSTLKTKTPSTGAIPKNQSTIVESFASPCLEIKSTKQPPQSSHMPTIRESSESNCLVSEINAKSDAKTTRYENKTEKLLSTILERIESMEIGQKNLQASLQKIEDKFDQFVARFENKPETERNRSKCVCATTTNKNTTRFSNLISFNDSGCLPLPLTPNIIVPPASSPDGSIPPENANLPCEQNASPQQLVNSLVKEDSSIDKKMDDISSLSGISTYSFRKKTSAAIPKEQTKHLSSENNTKLDDISSQKSNDPICSFLPKTTDEFRAKGAIPKYRSHFVKISSTENARKSDDDIVSVVELNRETSSVRNDPPLVFSKGAAIRKQVVKNPSNTNTDYKCDNFASLELRLEENAEYSPDSSVLDDSACSPLPDCAKLIRGNVSTPQSTTLTEDDRSAKIKSQSNKVVDETMKVYNDLRKRVPLLCTPKTIETNRTAFSLMTPSVKTDNKKYISRLVQEQILALENDE